MSRPDPNDQLIPVAVGDLAVLAELAAAAAGCMAAAEHGCLPARDLQAFGLLPTASDLVGACRGALDRLAPLIEAARNPR